MRSLGRLCNVPLPAMRSLGRLATAYPRIAAVCIRDLRMAPLCVRGPRIAAVCAPARCLTVRVPPASTRTVTDERRHAKDGVEYTRSEFIQYFGTSLGEKEWALADPRRHGVVSSKRGRSRGQGASPTAKPRVGDLVTVVEKKNYGTDVRIEGIVSRVLTKSAAHRHGFKVMLTTGIVGRCTAIRS